MRVKKKKGIQTTERERNDQPRVIYPAELSFKDEGEMNTLPDIQQLRKFIKGLFYLKQRTKGHKSTSKISNKLTA